jgi:hypothetical protein
MGKAVRLSKKFYDYCAQNAKKAKRRGVGN